MDQADGSWIRKARGHTMTPADATTKREALRWFDRKRIWFNARFRKRVNLYEVIMEVGSCNAMHRMFLTRRAARAECRKKVRETVVSNREALRQYPDLAWIFETPTMYAVDRVTHINGIEKRVQPRVDVFKAELKER